MGFFVIKKKVAYFSHLFQFSGILGQVALLVLCEWLSLKISFIEICRYFSAPRFSSSAMVLRLNFLDHIWCQVGVGSTYTIDFKSVDGVCLMVDFRTLKTCKPLPGDSTIFTAELIYFKSDKKCRIWPTRSVACNLLRLKECC